MDEHEGELPIQFYSISSMTSPVAYRDLYRGSLAFGWTGLRLGGLLLGRTQVMTLPAPRNTACPLAVAVLY
jgi:hypothetical protein